VITKVAVSRSALVLAMLLSGAAQADEAPTRPEKRESDEKPPPSVRLPTLLGGLGLTAGFWALNTGSSYVFPDSSGMTQLRIPVAGPWMGLANNHCPDDGCDAGFYFRTFYFIFSGIAQAGGIGVALESILVPTAAPGAVRALPRPGPTGPTEEAPDSPPPATDSPPPNKPLFFLPQPISFGKGSFGLGIGGLF
jgi:hypothetical protein